MVERPANMPGVVPSTLVIRHSVIRIFADFPSVGFGSGKTRVAAAHLPHTFKGESRRVRVIHPFTGQPAATTNTGSFNPEPVRFIP